jgi:hypothetical protein
MCGYPSPTTETTAENKAENLLARAEYILNTNIFRLRKRLYELFIKVGPAGSLARQQVREEGFIIEDATVLEWVAVRGTKNAEHDIGEFVEAIHSRQSRLRNHRSRCQWLQKVNTPSEAPAASSSAPAQAQAPAASSSAPVYIGKYPPHTVSATDSWQP